MTGTDTASIWAGILQIGTVALALVLLYRPLGDWMARVFTSTHDARVERGIYRVIGVDAASEQTWPAYTRGVLLFSLAGGARGARLTGYLRPYVSQLRKKLEADPAAPRHLLTESGMGYRLVVD